MRTPLDTPVKKPPNRIVKVTRQPSKLQFQAYHSLLNLFVPKRKYFLWNEKLELDNNKGRGEELVCHTSPFTVTGRGGEKEERRKRKEAEEV